MLIGTALEAQRLRDLTTPTPLAPGSTLVIGFLGGLEPWNDEHRSIRKLVLRRRDAEKEPAAEIAPSTP